MSKQDMNGVRTAQDLERKYNFSELEGNVSFLSGNLFRLKKTVELSQTGLTQVQSDLKSFVKATTEQFSDVQTELSGLQDGMQETWFYSGVPTLSNSPASDWSVEEYENHVGDMYYDTETGYAYRFALSGNEYGWLQIHDQDVVSALAIANAASDTADNKRRVFMARPHPPYDNGDLWINDEELYICQISKLESEEYADGDFIKALKYTDDTKATQVANELTVVQGQVTTVIKDNDEFKIKFTQTDNLVNSLTDEVAEEIDKREAMIRLGHEDGIPVVELGTTESPVKTKYKNDGMYIEENGSVTSYFKNGMAYNQNMEILDSLVLGPLVFKKRKNGNVSILLRKGQ